MPKLTVFLAVLLLCSTAFAETDEKIVGGSALIAMPQFQSQDKTAFQATTVGAHVFYQYGLFEDLYAIGQFSFWVIQNASTDYSFNDLTTERGYDGFLGFNGEGYHGELGARYKLYAGYNFAPYIEAYGGYLWTTFRNPDLKNEAGTSYGFDIESFGRGAFTVSGALGFDVRVWNLLMAGASVKYTMALDDVVKGTLSFPITLSYYW